MSTTYQVVERDITALRPYARNARTHSKKQIKQIARSIERFGFTNPVLISDEGEIIAGHGRVEAAKLIGWKQVPTITLSHLSEAERRAYVLADNKLALNAGWDKEILAIELQALVELEFDVELTGFSLAEIDLVLDEASEADPDKIEAPEDEVELATGVPVSRQGDLWLLGRHKLLCGDARSAIDFDALMAGEQADLVFTDPPYNVKIDGNVCGLGAVKYTQSRDPEQKARYLEHLQWEQRMFDLLNDMVGPRYKAKLQNRSYANGASREGTALDEIRRNKAMRSDYIG